MLKKSQSRKSILLKLGSYYSVVNPNKSDRLVVAFDCAAEVKAVSHNKTDPDLVNSFIFMLCFCKDAIALVADIDC